MRRLLASLALGAVLVALAWIARGVRPSEPELATPEGLAKPASATEPAGPIPIERAESSRRLDEREAGGGTQGLASSREQAPPLYRLILSFVLPDGAPVAVENARAVLTDREGRAWTFEGRVPVRELVGEVPLGAYELRAAAANHRHVLEALDLSDPGRMEDAGPAGERAFVHRVHLWPDEWIPLIVHTRDGRPFRALAEDLGLEPKRFFVDAFEVRASRDPITPAVPPPTAGEELALLLPPRGNQQVEIQDGIAGALHILAPRPFWVGLWIHGAFYESRLLAATDSELVFEIDMPSLDAHFARLTARLVDRDSGQPAVDARGELKADTSAHRREDLSEAAPDEDGRLAFERVVPGQHELTITRAHNFVQRRIVLAPGEQLDLGELSIGADPGVRLRVVGPDGTPLPSVIEIAPYEAGRAVDSLYHPNLHLTTDDAGVFLLPVPDRLSIVRARPFFNGGGNYPVQVGTRNVLLDPADLPVEIELRAERPARVRFEPMTPWLPNHRLAIENELGLVVATLERLDREVELVPGRYVLRRREIAREIGSLEVTVGPGEVMVRTP